MGVSKNRGTYPKMDSVKIMENPSKMDDLGVHLFLETPIFIDSSEIFWGSFTQSFFLRPDGSQNEEVVESPHSDLRSKLDEAGLEIFHQKRGGP